MNHGIEFQKYATKHLGMSSTKVEGMLHHTVLGLPVAQTPYILEERSMNVTQLDVFSRMMADRIIFLNEQVDDHSMGIINAQMLFLASLDDKKDIQLFLNSPGGGVIAGLSLYDTMQFISPDVATTTMGMAASMGSILASSGAKGKRSMLKHSRFMIHDIRGGAGGTYEDMKRSLELSKELREELFQILADNSGNTFDEIKEWCDRDNWMKSNEAKAKGFVDIVIEKSK